MSTISTINYRHDAKICFVISIPWYSWRFCVIAIQGKNNRYLHIENCYQNHWPLVHDRWYHIERKQHQQFSCTLLWQSTSHGKSYSIANIVVYSHRIEQNQHKWKLSWILNNCSYANINNGSPILLIVHFFFNNPFAVFAQYHFLTNSSQNYLYTTDQYYANGLRKGSV